MVTLPILATIFLALIIIGLLAQDEVSAGKALRALVMSVFGIVTVWLCFANPLGGGAMVCAIIYSAYCGLSLFISAVTGHLFKEGEGDAAFLALFLIGFVVTSMWVPWVYG